MKKIRFGKSVAALLSRRHLWLGILASANVLVLAGALIASADEVFPQRVAVDLGGRDHSSEPSLSADGRYVTFFSDASYLVPNDLNGKTDVFVYDRVTETTERVSVASNGDEANGTSIGRAPISADGRYVVIHSDATNLVPGDTNGVNDVFVHDRITRMTERVSLASDGSEGNTHSGAPAISADGRYVTFASQASNLVLHDTNGAVDVFVHDRVTGTTERVSVASDGSEANNHSSPGFHSISFDGRYVVFKSNATNLVLNDTNGKDDVFLHDRITGKTVRVSLALDGSEGNNHSAAPAISADGRYVTFASQASNLVPNDLSGKIDVFVYDNVTGMLERVSVAPDGSEANGSSFGSAPISAYGRYVVFISQATNLVPGDTNEFEDVFLHDRDTGLNVRMNVGWDGSESNDGFVEQFTSSADGQYVAFGTYATNMVPNDLYANHEVFLTKNPRFASNQAPLVEAGPGQGVSEGSPVTFSGSFTDPDPGDTHTIQWDFGDNNTTPGILNPAHAYDDNGTYMVTLTVTDSQGNTDSDSLTVTVNNVPPTADFANTTGTIMEDQSVTLAFNNQFDPGMDDVAAGYVYHYDCTGDGTFELSNSLVASFSCTYPVSGDYNATGRIADKDGGFTDYTSVITVLTPSEAIYDLVDIIETFNLHQGINNSLDAKLDSAQKALEDINQNNDIAAINSLQAFINAVEAQRGKSLTDAQADALVNAAQVIIDSLLT